MLSFVYKYNLSVMVLVVEEVFTSIKKTVALELEEPLTV